MADHYEVRHASELEVIDGSGGARWMLARRGLGIDAFGINLVEIPSGGSIVEHDETGSGQIEVYAILEGEGVLLIDGEEHAAPAGTWARLDPAASRNILNRSETSLTALLIGVPPETGYQPMEWA